MKIIYDFKELKGETISDICTVKAEFGRTYDQYIAITCESGKRVLFFGCKPYEPKPTLEEMRKTAFFTVDEICEKVRKDEMEKRKIEQNSVERKRQEFERLKSELGFAD